MKCNANRFPLSPGTAVVAGWQGWPGRPAVFCSTISPSRSLKTLLFCDRVSHVGQGVPGSLATPHLIFLKRCKGSWREFEEEAEEREMQGDVHSVPQAPAPEAQSHRAGGSGWSPIKQHRYHHYTRRGHCHYTAGD